MAKLAERAPTLVAFDFDIVFSDLHGIEPEDIADEAALGDIRPQVKPVLSARILAARNARFDLGAIGDHFGVSFEPRRTIEVGPDVNRRCEREASRRE